jgi:single-strand DNA-binding protein
MDLNRAQIIGNVTQDLELRQTPNWQNVVSFWVATNRNWTDQSWMKQEQVEFHNVVFWWKLAEIAHQYLKKWKKVYIEWRLQTRNWDAQDWTKRYKTEIIWENMIMLDWKWWDSNFNVQNNSTVSAANTTPAISSKEPKKEEGLSIEDIPF